MVLDDLLLAIILKNIMNVTEHLFNPLAFWENEKRARETERTEQSALFPIQGFLSHDAAVNLVSGPQWHISAQRRSVTIHTETESRTSTPAR